MASWYIVTLEDKDGCSMMQCEVSTLADAKWHAKAYIAEAIDQRLSEAHKATIQNDGGHIVWDKKVPEIDC